MAQSREFQDLRFSPGDKSILNSMSKDPKLVRFKILDGGGGKVKDIWHKVFYLIQVCLEGGSIDNKDDQLSYSLVQDSQVIFQQAHRIVKCIYAFTLGVMYV